MSRHLGYVLGCSSEAYQSMGKFMAAAAILENTLRQTLFKTLQIDDRLYQEFIGDEQIARQCTYMNVATRCANWPTPLKDAWSLLSIRAQHIGRVRNVIAHQVAYQPSGDSVVFSVYSMRPAASGYGCDVRQLNRFILFTLEISGLISRLPSIKWEEADAFHEEVKTLHTSPKKYELPTDPKSTGSAKKEPITQPRSFRG